MQRQFLSNLILLVVLNLLVKPFAIFGIDATVQNRVGAEQYGLYFSLLNLSFLFNIVMDLGINNFTTRNIAQYPVAVSRYLGKIFSFRLILFALYTIITLVLGVGIGYRGHELFLLLVLILNQFLVIVIAYIRSHLGGLHFFKTDAIMSVLDRVLLILLCGFLLLDTSKTFTIDLFIWMQFISYLVALVIGFIFLVRRVGIPRFQFSWVFSLAILRKSYPYALLILLMMLYTRIDSIMIQRLHSNGSYETGIYAQGFRLLDAFFMFGMLFANLLLPMFSKQLKIAPEQLGGLLKVSRNILVGGSIFVATFCIAHADFLLDLIYKNDIKATVPSFQILMATFTAMCISLIYSTLITAGGKLRLLNQMSIVSIFLNVSLNLCLIPTYGAYGAGIATLITQSIAALFQLVYVHRNWRLSDRSPELLKYIGFSIWMVLTSIILNEKEAYLGIHLAIGMVGLFLFRMIDFKGLKNWMQTQ